MVSLPRQKMSPGDLRLYESLGAVIKDYRQWRELSQETFAESIRISVRELQRWEADRRRARIENLHDLSEVTGIPMQVCVALNADQPVWYALRERRFVYSSIEIAQFIKFVSDDLFKCPQSDEGILIKNDRIATDKHINAILSCHHDIYGTERPLRRDALKTASMILPDLNRIAFDSWGHYMGHVVCLPIKTDVYQQLKQEKFFEDLLTTERMSDIVALHEGAFFYYSLFAASSSVAYPLIITNIPYLAKIEPKESYLVAGYSATMEGKEILNNLGMRTVRHTRNREDIHAEAAPALCEIELDAMMRPLEPLKVFGADD
jgi:transcriptional regulator with XRE-family HTH domain